MYIRRNLNRQLRIFIFHLKDIKMVFPVPLIVLFIFIPIILLMTQGKYHDLEYVRENFILLTQYFVPLLSVWWFCFSFIEEVESAGNEVFYLENKMKDSQGLLWLLFYLFFVTVGFFIMGFFLDNIFLEYLRICISCCFYMALAYSTMFLFSSMTGSFLVVMVYWLSSSFGSGIPINILNCYDGNYMTIQLLLGKYVYIMLAAIGLYVLGMVANSRKEKFN